MKRILLALTAILLGISTATCFADTIKLAPTTAYTSQGVAVYPYNFSVNGSTTTTPLMCINYDLTVSVGEKWNVAISALSSSLTDQAAINYRTGAYLYSQMGTDANTNIALQYAAWSLFSPGMTVPTLWKQAASDFLTTAGAMAKSTSLINSGFFAKFQLYTPLTDAASAASWTYGMPQSYIGMAPTPEPSALLLMGTGLLGTVGVMRRKRNAQAQA